MKLSDFSSDNQLVKEGEFVSLGYADSTFPHTLAFADSLKYVQLAISNPNVSCIITTPALVEAVPSSKGVLTSSSPRQAFYTIHEQFIKDGTYELPFDPGIGEGCDIHPSAIIGKNCRIGDNVKIGEFVVIRDNAWIGSNVTIEAGVKIGVEGILYSTEETSISLIPHAGYVRIHDGAILMTNSIVVRSVHPTDVTEIGSGALIGLGSIIGHEAKVGDLTIVSNQCVIARRAKTGRKVFVGTNSTIKEHIDIGDQAKIMAGSIVINDVAPNASVSGNFASNHKRRLLDFVRNKSK